MQVTEILDKITQRNTPVIGCIARKGDQLHHNLGDFDLDCAQIADTMQDLLPIADLIEDGGPEIDTVFSEYDGQCLIVQRIEDTLLVTVSDHLHRGGFKKLQVGLSLQTRLLSKAMDAEQQPIHPAAPIAQAEPVAQAEPAPGQEDQTAPSPEGAPEPPSAWHRLLQAVAPKQGNSSRVEDVGPVNAEGKTRRVYRGQVYYE